MRKEYDILLLSLLFVLFVSLSLFLSKSAKILVIYISPQKMEVDSGDVFEGKVLLKGTKEYLENVLAVDVKVNYDKDKLGIVSVIPGSFFQDPMIVKWDQGQGFFSIAANPTKNEKVKLNTEGEGELLKIEFKAGKGSGSSGVSFAKVTLVYVSGSGGIYPKQITSMYTIK